MMGRRRELDPLAGPGGHRADPRFGAGGQFGEPGRREIGRVPHREGDAGAVFGQDEERAVLREVVEQIAEVLVHVAFGAFASGGLLLGERLA